MMPDFGEENPSMKAIREMEARLTETMKKILDTPRPESVVLLKRAAVDRGFAAVYDDVLERFDDPEDRYRQFYKRGLIDALKHGGRFEP